MALNFFVDEELMVNFQKKKTEISCMKEDPMIFLNLLKDHGLIPKEKCTRLKGLKDEEKRQALYDMLENIEEEKSQEIRTFWECVSKEPILKRYPTLRSLYENFKEQRVKDNGHLDHDQMQTNGQNISSNIRDDEQPGPSSHQTAYKKKTAKKPDLSSLIKNKKILKVTCGKKKGKLIRRNLSSRVKCIKADGKLFTPNEFQEYGGKGNNKNWKSSIKFEGIPLGKFIEAGLLRPQ